MAYLRFGEKPDLIVYTEHGHLTYLPSATPESQRHISFTYQVALALRARRRARAISPGSATMREILEPHSPRPYQYNCRSLGTPPNLPTGANRTATARVSDGFGAPALSGELAKSHPRNTSRIRLSLSKL